MHPGRRRRRRRRRRRIPARRLRRARRRRRRQRRKELKARCPSRAHAQRVHRLQFVGRYIHQIIVVGVLALRVSGQARQVAAAAQVGDGAVLAAPHRGRIVDIVLVDEKHVVGEAALVRLGVLAHGVRPARRRLPLARALPLPVEVVHLVLADAHPSRRHHLRARATFGVNLVHVLVRGNRRPVERVRLIWLVVLGEVLGVPNVAVKHIQRRRRGDGVGSAWRRRRHVWQPHDGRATERVKVGEVRKIPPAVARVAPARVAGVAFDAAFVGVLGVAKVGAWQMTRQAGGHRRRTRRRRRVKARRRRARGRVRHPRLARLVDDFHRRQELAARRVRVIMTQIVGLAHRPAGKAHERVAREDLVVEFVPGRARRGRVARSVRAGARVVGHFVGHHRVQGRRKVWQRRRAPRVGDKRLPERPLRRASRRKVRGARSGRHGPEVGFGVRDPQDQHPADESTILRHLVAHALRDAVEDVVGVDARVGGRRRNRGQTVEEQPAQALARVQRMQLHLDDGVRHLFRSALVGTEAVCRLQIAQDFAHAIGRRRPRNHGRGAARGIEDVAGHNVVVIPRVAQEVGRARCRVARRPDTKLVVAERRRRRRR